MDKSKEKILKKYLKNESPDATSRTLLHWYGDDCNALLYSELFHPRFYLIEDSVMFPFNYYEGIESKFIKFKNEYGKIKAEQEFNNIYLIDLFQGDHNKKDFELVSEQELLVNELFKCWNAILRLNYPHKDIKLVKNWDDGDINGISFTMYE